MNLKIFFFIPTIIIFLNPGIGISQPYDTMRSRFILSVNEFQNAQYLQDFRLKIDSLSKGEKQKVTILHIGDSHLQGDYTSRTIRYKLQSKFGNRGRGLTFPFSLAKTYGPTDYQNKSNSLWEVAKMFPGERDIPVGLVGYSISTSNKSEFTQIFRYNEKIKWGVYPNPNELQSAKFNSANLILSYSGGLNLKISTQDFKNNIQTTLIPLPRFSELKDTLIKIQFSSQFDELNILIDFSDSINNRFNLHGIVVENTQELGILYHVAGVGACQLSDFLKASRFYQNIISLKPDLIIFALGANESITKNFDTAQYRREYSELIQKLRLDIQGINFIIQTPPDIIYRKKTPVSINKITNVLRAISISEKTSFWDFNSIMGGIGSNQTWFKNNLISSDRIHFKPSGYNLVGLLFLDAFNKLFKISDFTKIDVTDLEKYSFLFNKIQLIDTKSDTLPINRETSWTNSNTPKPKNKPNKNFYSHTVKKGETIYSIAKRYNLTQSELLNKNKLNINSTIYPGQKIRIR